MINFRDKKLLIFDYDGTIADTNFLHEMAFREVLNFKELTFNYEQIAGIKTVEAINFLLPTEMAAILQHELIKDAVFFSIISK